MKIAGPLYEAEFLERPNRFLARVNLRGRIVDVHVRDPGRLVGLLAPGRTVYLSPAGNVSRKTRYDLTMVRHGEILISMDTTLPNRLIHEELSKGRIEEFRRYEQFRSEVRYGSSRLDFLLTSESKLCYVEVKSATLVSEGVAMFPDAVTSRGARHVLELLDACRAGHEACVIFVVQREDARCLVPQDDIDPRFGRALRKAVIGGVKVIVYRCRVSMEEVVLDGRIELNLQKR